MEQQSAEEIFGSLRGVEIVFRYFKDRYALQLLAYAAAEGRSVSEMRAGRFRPLLQKPAVRRILAETDTQHVTWDLLDSYFPTPTEEYGLTFALWGHDDDWGWNRHARPGLNVVLQLNFPLAHDRAYRRFIQPGSDHPWESCAHPIHRHGRHTLAWARIDIDLESGEALIEEIQSDWVRDATSAAHEALESLVRGELTRPAWAGDAACDALQLFRYVEHVMSRHRRLWDQAVLAASLWLLRERLGIRRVYMHTFESGCKLKHMRFRPPRSLYEHVPRSFCFERVAGVPGFLRSDLERRGMESGHEFWYLRL